MRAVYASLNAHRKLEQSRRDDLWSLLYVIVELIYGTLPWRVCKLAQRDASGETYDHAKLIDFKEKCQKQPQLMASKGSSVAMPQARPDASPLEAPCTLC